MIQPDKRPEHSKECPKGIRKFYAFVHFLDDSTCLWSNIFTFNRSYAHLLVLEKFGDCLEYISSINIHESEY